MAIRKTGIVKWWDDAKGFGFILPSEGGNDIFVHYTGIEGGGRRTLDEAQQVEFDIEEGKRGPQAVNVV